MDYKGCFGKTVMVSVDRDINGSKIDNRFPHVVTFYMDSGAETVGIYPLVEGGYTKDDLLSFQPRSNTVYVKDLTEVTQD